MRIVRRTNRDGNVHRAIWHWWTRVARHQWHPPAATWATSFATLAWCYHTAARGGTTGALGAPRNAVQQNGLNSVLPARAPAGRMGPNARAMLRASPIRVRATAFVPGSPPPLRAAPPRATAASRCARLSYSPLAPRGRGAGDEGERFSPARQSNCTDDRMQQSAGKLSAVSKTAPARVIAQMTAYVPPFSSKNRQRCRPSL